MWPFKRRKNEVKARDEPLKVNRNRNLWMINRPRADNTIQGNEAIYAAVSRIANTMGMIPMHIYKDYAIQPKHPLERLLALEPNPNFTAFGFRQTMEVLHNIEGNAYALRVLDRLGGLLRLDILNPTRVQLMRDPADGSTWYQIMVDDGVAYTIPGYMVLNLRHMSANGEKGIRPIDVLRKSLDYDAQVKSLREFATLFRVGGFELASTDIGGSAWRTDSTEIRGIARLGVTLFDDKAMVRRSLTV